MDDLLQRITVCVERGKVNREANYPPELKGQDGCDELTRQALDKKIPPADILNQALIVAMQHVGEKFRDNLVFVPDVLMSAKAMNAAMQHLKPYFQSGQVKRKGTVVMGTVAGDLHDIGKKIVAMMFEGGGWEVVDLGVDVSAEKFVKAVDEKPGALVGLSALLTTTMMNMEGIIRAVKTKHPKTRVLVGGAPLTNEFAAKIQADFYSPDPQGALEYINRG